MMMRTYTGLPRDILTLMLPACMARTMCAPAGQQQERSRKQPHSRQRAEHTQKVKQQVVCLLAIRAVRRAAVLHTQRPGLSHNSPSHTHISHLWHAAREDLKSCASTSWTDSCSATALCFGQAWLYVQPEVWQVVCSSRDLHCRVIQVCVACSVPRLS